MQGEYLAATDHDSRTQIGSSLRTHVAVRSSTGAVQRQNEPKPLDG